MGARQAKDGRRLRNRLTVGERFRQKSTNRHLQAPSDIPDCPRRDRHFHGRDVQGTGRVRAFPVMPGSTVVRKKG